MYRSLAASALFCVSAAFAFAANDSAMLALVPANAQVIAGVNVQQAVNSPFGQFLLSRSGPDGNGFDKMFQSTGFDPRRDLQSFVFASTGPNSDAAQSNFVFIARGNFPAQRMRDQALAHGGTPQNFAGIDLYVSSDHGQKTAFGLLPDSGLAVFGDLASVQQVISNRATPSAIDPALQALIGKVSQANDAWFASLLSGSYLTQHLNGATGNSMKSQAQALQSVHQAAGGLQFGDPIQLTFDAVTRSPKDATSLADIFRFMASLVQMGRQQNPQADMLASALDGMVLNTSDNNFHMNLAIPEKSLEQLADSGIGAKRHHGSTTDKQ